MNLTPESSKPIPGPPYAPTTASAGSVPSKSLDVPIDAVFIALFVIGAACHMTIFQINRRRNYKFVPSAATFGFCMARIVANVLRIVWACYPTNIRLALAAQIFVYAGILILFILNLIYAQRMLRAYHPNIGWSRFTSTVFKVIWVLLVISLAALIVVVIQSFYTLNPNTKRIDRDIQLYALTYFMTLSFLPIPILALTLLASRNKFIPIDSFGEGSWFAKCFILFFTSMLLCFGAAFRTGTTYRPPRPLSDPAWYQGKACFFIVNFTIEIIVVYTFLFARVDKRFYVPDGSSKVRHYRDKKPEGEFNLIDMADGNVSVSQDTLHSAVAASTSHILSAP